MAEADFVVLVEPFEFPPPDAAAGAASPGTGAGTSVRADEWPRPPDLVVLSKSDLSDQARGTESAAVVRPWHPYSDPVGNVAIRAVAVGALNGENMASLRRALDELAFGRGGSEATLALTARHVAAVEEALAALDRATASAGGPSELTAAELRAALDALGKVRGHMSPDELLGRIFGQFCIGK